MARYIRISHTGSDTQAFSTFLWHTIPIPAHSSIAVAMLISDHSTFCSLHPRSLMPICQMRSFQVFWVRIRLGGRRGRWERVIEFLRVWIIDLNILQYLSRLPLWLLLSSDFFFLNQTIFSRAAITSPGKLSSSLFPYLYKTTPQFSAI